MTQHPQEQEQRARELLEDTTDGPDTGGGWVTEGRAVRAMIALANSERLAPSAVEGAVERAIAAGRAYIDWIAMTAKFSGDDGRYAARRARELNEALLTLTPTTGDTPATREEGREG